MAALYKELIRTNKKSIRSSIYVSKEHEKIIYLRAKELEGSAECSFCGKRGVQSFPSQEIITGSTARKSTPRLPEYVRLCCCQRQTKTKNETGHNLPIR